MPESLSFATQIDAFLSAVKKAGKVTLPEIAGKLGISEETAEHWSLVLERKGLLKLTYPENPFDKPFVRAAEPAEGKK